MKSFKIASSLLHATALHHVIQFFALMRDRRACVWSSFVCVHLSVRRCRPLYQALSTSVRRCRPLCQAPSTSPSAYAPIFLGALRSAREKSMALIPLGGGPCEMYRAWTKLPGWGTMRDEKRMDKTVWAMDSGYLL